MNWQKLFEQGCKPSEQWRIGVEQERILLHNSDQSPIPFRADSNVDKQVSIEQLFKWLIEKKNWRPVYYELGGYLKAQEKSESALLLAIEQRGLNMTLEPAGQLELATNPAKDLRSLASELADWHQLLREAAHQLGLLVLLGGSNPKYLPDEMPWIPKQRYQLMRKIFSTTGDLGHYMMSLTSATQASLDYSDEQDCLEKFHLATMLTPLVTAMYANSPLIHGKATGYVSYRAHIWLDTDPSRCGLPLFALDSKEHFFNDYVDHAMKVPMFFHQDFETNRQPSALIEERRPFADYLKSQAQHLADWQAESDWQLHLSTLFYDVRLKNFIEFRAPDSNRPELVMAFPAFCKGLFYDKDAKQAAIQLLSGMSSQDYQQARQSAAKLGLSAATYGRHKALELASELVTIAHAGLQALQEDTHYLEPLISQVNEKKCSPGEELLRRWHSDLNQDTEKLIQLLASDSC